MHRLWQLSGWERSGTVPDAGSLHVGAPRPLASLRSELLCPAAAARLRIHRKLAYAATPALATAEQAEPPAADPVGSLVRGWRERQKYLERPAVAVLHVLAG